VHCLHFADGTQYEAELVIGADGIKSATRGAVVGTENNVLQFTNTVAYRGLVSTEKLKQDGLKTDLGKRIWNFIGIDKVGVPISNCSKARNDLTTSAAYHSFPNQVGRNGNSYYF
jgi:hypothetical protein